MYSDLHLKLIQDQTILKYKPDCKSIYGYFAYLQEAYGFGSDSMATMEKNITRKIIFDIALRPVLQYCLNTSNVNLYSIIDHFLFKAYICQIEDLKWFSNAFWDVNSYGLAIARNLSKSIKAEIRRKEERSKEKKILIVFKGPLILAHSKVLQDFLDGASSKRDQPEIHLLLIDNKSVEIKNVIVKSLASINDGSTIDKLSEFVKYCKYHDFYNIIWVASIQNLTLYMGLGMAKNQTYWTMKRHSIVFPEVTKYATFISQYRNQFYNNVFWFGGRYRLKAEASTKTNHEILRKFDPKILSIIQKKFVFGSLARSQKYQKLDYWKGIEYLLHKCPDSVFVFGTQNLSSDINLYIKSSKILQARTINFGWLNGETADIASLIQVYIDTIPFGSGLTAAECILSKGCYLGTISEINKEASFTNILTDSINLVSKHKVSYDESLNSIGIFSSYSDCINYAIALKSNPKLLLKMHSLQKYLLKNLDALGEKYFFEDYVNFFRS